MIKKNEGDFSYFLVKPSPTTPSIMSIILYHGWGSSALKYLEYATSMARKGFTVIIPELIHHDERSPLPNPYHQKVVETYFWKVICQSIDECHTWLNRSNIIKENTVVTGISMGGFIASGIFATTELKGLASISGSGSFITSERLFRLAAKRNPLTIEEEGMLKKYDPTSHAHGNGEILLLHGEKDHVVSIKGQEAYYAYLTKSEKKVKMKRYKNVAHEFTALMESDLLSWLEIQASHQTNLKK